MYNSTSSPALPPVSYRVYAVLPALPYEPYGLNSLITSKDSTDFDLFVDMIFHVDILYKMYPGLILFC